MYRFEEAAFEGQKPDKEATEKLVAERLQKVDKDPMIENFNTPFLFRKAIVVVSWSRYMAVSTLYGAPSDEMVKQWETEQFAKMQQQEQGDSEAPIKQGLIYQPSDSADSNDASKGADRPKDFKCNVAPGSPLRKQVSGDSSLEEESFGGSEPTSADFQDVDVEDDENVAADTGPSTTRLVLEGEGPVDLNSQSVESQQLPTSSSSTTTPQGARTASASSTTSGRTSFRTWAKQKSRHFREKSRSALEKSGIISKTTRRDPLEGVIHLSKPLLLCQEIYTRIIGNHQTSVISKTKAIELLKEDIAQHEREDPEAARKNEDDDPFMTGQEVILRSRSEDSGGGEPEHKSVDPEDLANLGTNGSGISDSSISDGRQHSDGHWLSRSGDEEENHSRRAHGDSGTEEEQELVGYWLWENTLRTHKMKMHVAQGTDLALHVVLAIIVNQVRYERNALAMTI